MLVDCARCVDLDPRKYDGHLNIPEAFRLLENILAGEVVAALLEELFEHNSLAITGEIIAFPNVGAGKVLCKERPVAVHAFVIVPFRIRWVLVEGAHDHACCLVESGRLQGGRDRTGWEIHNERGLPTDLRDLAYRLRRKLRCTCHEQRLRSRTFQIYHLRIDSRVGDLVCRLLLEKKKNSIYERDQSRDIVFAE